MKKKNRHILRNSLIIILIIVAALVITFKIKTKITPPHITDLSILEVERENPAPDFYKIGNSWLKKNKFGLWEMYIEGSPFEIGVINGKLTHELIKIQEDAFVEQINTLIPSKSYLHFLKYFIGWFNRDIDEYIPDEYLQEIYGVSFGASSGYEYIGNNYERMLNYHGAHDIGHALQSLALVGCTSFASNLHTPDSSMIIGRNFDFFVNETFAKNKIVAFVNPQSGHKFMYLTWASMIGVVSGMNEKGLTVTINAAKSDIPTKAATPISILAREILQYASNINEAIAIAKKREIFVSESLFIGSAADNNAVIIEKSPSKLGVYSTSATNLVCSNHFKSDEFSTDENNVQQIKESASNYREIRCNQLINNTDTINYEAVADILRNYNGIDDVNIGYGNEKTMAQMISHHSIIFLPKKLITWVSTPPYQFGEYLSYDIKQVLNAKNINQNTILYDSVLNISQSPFATSIQFESFNDFKKYRKTIQNSIANNKEIENEDELINKLINSNPQYYQGYLLAANYYYMLKNNKEAILYYKKALTKELENTSTKLFIQDKINEIDNNSSAQKN